jgi:hypothetical protein
MYAKQPTKHQKEASETITNGLLGLAEQGRIKTVMMWLKPLRGRL